MRHPFGSIIRKLRLLPRETNAMIPSSISPVAIAPSNLTYDTVSPPNILSTCFAIAKENKSPLIFISYYRLTMEQPAYSIVRLYLTNKYSDNPPHYK